MGWTQSELPHLGGKTYVVTGGNSGIGREAAQMLAIAGARVVITSRREDRAQDALRILKAAAPDADLDWVQLDLADLAQVEKTSDALREMCPTIHGLINNAGVMQTPERRTAQGFELQFGTNHLGHFKLNSLLYPHLERSGARIVPVASVIHKYAAIRLEDLNFESTAYDPTEAYGQSKLANLLFAFELQRRLEHRRSSVSSIAAHPGYAATNLQSAGVGMSGGSKVFKWIYKLTNAVVAQSAEAGARPLVLAAASPDARPGAYYGPTGMGQMWGPVGESFVADGARDERLAAALWDKTEALVGPFFPGGAANRGA